MSCLNSLIFALSIFSYLCASPWCALCTCVVAMMSSCHRRWEGHFLIWYMFFWCVTNCYNMSQPFLLSISPVQASKVKQLSPILNSAPSRGQSQVNCLSLELGLLEFVSIQLSNSQWFGVSRLLREVFHHRRVPTSILCGFQMDHNWLSQAHSR